MSVSRTQKRRLGVATLIVIGVGAAVAIALAAFQQNLMFFYSPSQVYAGEAPANHTFRIGGLVVEDSVARDEDGLTVRFVLTDTAQEVPVVYTGILPDLFREGQGIVAQGQLDARGVFVAERVLAKHDENYMPPAVYDALKAAEKNTGAAP